MRLFKCQCGQRVFFESKHCVHCGTALGFDPALRKMIALQGCSDGIFSDAANNTYRYCQNGIDYDVCNWLVPAPHSTSTKPAHAPSIFCQGCNFNRTIPNLQKAVNLRRWQKIEAAKKRLLYTLIQLQLPLASGHQHSDCGLLFDFIEDERSDPLRYPESFASTGHDNGVITINVLEADDVAREEIKQEMNEHYRTLLGHLRHESGHYYWMLARHDNALQRDFADLFGDPAIDYTQSLATYYQSGPTSSWQQHYISSYASSHPLEDWAETWGHYLHIYDALETAAAFNVIDQHPSKINCEQRITLWRDISITLNELNRSSGLADIYPFVMNAAVEKKLLMVDRVITTLSKNAG